MWAMKVSIGPAEVAAAAGLAFLAGLAVLFVLEWPVGLIPAVTFAMASSAAYAGYRLHEREQARAARAKVVQFRVIDRHGVCPLGRHVGDVISYSGEHTEPFICEEARAVLAMATSGPDWERPKEWCCPVYEHMLVFRREKAAA
jgi:uncharacterized repeat protein (TIGR04076 family)